MIVRNLVLFKGKDMSIEGVIVVEVSQCDAHELTRGWKKLLLQDSEMIQGTQRVWLKISWYQYFSHLINQLNVYGTVVQLSVGNPSLWDCFKEKTSYGEVFKFVVVIFYLFIYIYINFF